MSEDLQALLAELALAPLAIIPLPRVETPANQTHAYRLELPDGTRRKAVDSWSARRAAIVEQALERLRLPALPRLFGRRGRAMVFEWIEGEPVGNESLAAAAALLGRVHALAPEDLVTEPRFEPATATDRLAEQTHHLLAEGMIDHDRAVRILALPPPPRERPRFVHGDFCAENLLVSNGALRIIDNGSWSVAPACFDLGRVLWRWPMGTDDRARFLDAYRRAGGAEVDLDALAFWTVVSAVAGTAYRIGGPIAAAARRLQEII